MKKSERKAEIRKRAYEYAKSGECNGWLSIEHKIAYVDGFHGAKTELNYPHIRQELDSLCAIATSPEESSRRHDFNQWIDRVVKEVGPQLKERMLELYIFPSMDILCVSGPNYSLEIRRNFSSKKLEYAKLINSKSGDPYRIGFEKIPVGKDFDGMTMEDVADMILTLKDKAESMAAYM
jgi:hypothetical protein